MADHVRVTLSPPQIALSPAAPRAEVRVGLTNGGASVEQIAVTVEGIDPAWLTAPPVTPLLPGDATQVLLSLHIPPGVTVQPRLLPLVVRARSAVSGAIVGSAATTLNLSAATASALGGADAGSPGISRPMGQGQAPTPGAAPSSLPAAVPAIQPPAAAGGHGKQIAAGLTAFGLIAVIALAALLLWQRRGEGGGAPVAQITATPSATAPADGASGQDEPRVLEARYDGVHLCAPAPTSPPASTPTPAPANVARSATPARPTPRPTAAATRPAAAPEGLGGGGASGPYFAQEGPGWSRDEYDHGARQNIGCGTTISNCGCAMTSLATVMSLYGVAIAPNGSELNPRTFNDYLNANARLTQSGWVSDGYVFGSVVWSSANQFTSAAAGGRPGAPAVRFRGLGSGSVEEIRAELRAGKPVVLAVPGHWIAAVGLDGDRILINDPFYRNRTTLDAYTGKVLESRLYDSSGSMSALSVTVPADQRVEVRDPRGRVIGTFGGLTPRDAIAQARRQIPNATIFFNEAVRDPNCINRPPPPNTGTITVYIPDPAPGGYQIGVQNPGGGPVTGVVHGYDGSGQVTITTEEGRGAIRFDYSYQPRPAATATATASPTAPGEATPAPADTPTPTAATPDATTAPATPTPTAPATVRPPGTPSSTVRPPTVAPPTGATTPVAPTATPPASGGVLPSPTPPPPPTAEPTPPPRAATPQPTAAPTARPTEPPATATASPPPATTRTPTPTPTVPACPAFSDLLLTGALTSPGPAQPVVTLSWKATGGCPPFTGTLSARYTDSNQPFEQNQVSGSEGIGNSRPTPRTCLVPTTYVVQYTLELRDGAGTVRRQETRVGIPCGASTAATPTPAATATPSSALCLPLSNVTIAAMPGPPGATMPVTLTWSATNGCQPFTGTITGGYLDQGATSDQFAITTSVGLTNRTLPRRGCSAPTTYRISYRIQLQDAAGGSGSATSAFDVPCTPPPSHRFSGAVRYSNNSFPPAGTVIDAVLYDSNSLGEVCGTGKVAAGGGYTIIVLAASERAGCGSNGQFIHFIVGGATASPQVPFQSGGNTDLNLELP